MDPAYLWSVINPSNIAYDAPPAPSVYPLSSFTKRIDFSLQWVVHDRDAATGASRLLGEQVSNSRGAIIWMPNRGINSLWRFGFVPIGTVASADPADPAQTGTGLVLPYPPNTTNYSTLTFTGELAIPYGQVSDFLTQQTHLSKQIKYSPDVTNLFSTARSIAGSVSVVSDTHSIAVGGASLNGLLSAGTFNDIRSVFQVVNSRGEYTSLTSTDIAQNTSTEKDKIIDVPATTGVALLLGPDIAPFMGPPNVDLYDEISGHIDDIDFMPGNSPALGVYENATGERVPAAGDIVTGVPNSGFPGLSFLGQLSAHWISPWAITYTGSYEAANPGFKGPAASKTVQNRMGPCGTFDLRVHARCSGLYDTNAPTASHCYEYQVRAVHVFANATTEGRVHYFSYMEAKTVPSVTQTNPRTFPPGAPDPVPGYDSIIAEFSPRQFTKGIAHPTNLLPDDVYHTDPCGAMYLGTLLEVWLHYQNGTGDVLMPDMTRFHVNVRSRNLYGMGQIGPARVVKYENLDEGQGMSVKGAVQTQGTSFGDIAPFVRTAIGSDAEMHMDIVTRMSRMFNQVTNPMKRVWNLKDYVAFIGRGPPSAELIQRWNDEAEEHARGKRGRNNTTTANVTTSANAKNLKPGDVSNNLAGMDLHLMAVSKKPKYAGNPLQMHFQ